MDTWKESPHDSCRTPNLQSLPLNRRSYQVQRLLFDGSHYRNLVSFNVQGLRFTPGWAVGWFFIPFANFVMSPLILTKIWRASTPHVQADGLAWRRAPISVEKSLNSGSVADAHSLPHTELEQKVLIMVSKRRPDSEIARILDLSPSQVQAMIDAFYSKFDLNSDIDLIWKARKLGYLPE